jgi:hypothetical protein
MNLLWAMATLVVAAFVLVLVRFVKGAVPRREPETRGSWGIRKQPPFHVRKA